MQVGNYIYQRRKPFRKKIRINMSFAFQVVAGQKLPLDTPKHNKYSLLFSKKNLKS